MKLLQKDIYKLIFSKFIFFSILFLSAELAFKARRWVVYCYKNEYCNYLNDVFKLKSQKFEVREKHKTLGFTVKENLNLRIADYYWENINLKTGNYGIRKDKENNNPIKILVVGESHAFGWQVKNNQTWQSCLNRNQKKYNFLNAAAPGDGPGLSFLRAQSLSTELKPELILLTTVFGAGVDRDRKSFAGGYSTPAVIKTLRGLEFAKPSQEKLLGSKNSNKEPRKIDYLMASSDLVSKYFTSRYRQIVNNSIEKVHKDAASKEDIFRWLVKKTKNNKIPIIWVFQYQKDITKNMIEDRIFLKELLNKEQVEFIDTYDYLHGEKSNFEKNELWNHHHTYLGNSQVCKSILNYFQKSNRL